MMHTVSSLAVFRAGHGYVRTYTGEQSSSRNHMEVVLIVGLYDVLVTLKLKLIETAVPCKSPHVLCAGTPSRQTRCSRWSTTLCRESAWRVSRSVPATPCQAARNRGKLVLGL